LGKAEVYHTTDACSKTHCREGKTMLVNTLTCKSCLSVCMCVRVLTGKYKS